MPRDEPLPFGDAPPVDRLPGWSADAMLDLLSQDVGATIAVVSNALVVQYVNAEFSRWFGEPPEAVVGRGLRALYGEINFTRFMPFVERALAGERVSYQRLLINPEGVEEWRTICLTPWRTPAGTVGGFITAALGVHELQVAVTALRAANQRLSSHMDNSPLAVLEMDPQLRVLHCSHRAVRLMGWGDLVQVEGRPLLDMLSPCAGDPRLHDALHRLQTGADTQNRVETCLARPDGTEVHCEWFNSALVDEVGRVTSVMALVQDVSQRAQIAREHHYLAHHDSLTGLYNRSAFHTRLADTLQRVAGQGTVALMFIDLDGFKDINDQEGHHAGDEVLRIVAQRLGRVVRTQDTVARVGGDEFVVLLDSDVTQDLPSAIGERVIEALSQPMQVGARQLAIGASIGVAVHPPIAAEVDVLLRRADQAMYAAKRSGKGRLEYATV